MENISNFVNGDILSQAESGLNKKEPSPMMLIMDYMKKHIEQIDKARINLKSQYPDLLP